MTAAGPTVAVYDPARFAFTLAAVHACDGAEAAAALADKLRDEYPGAVVTVIPAAVAS